MPPILIGSPCSLEQPGQPLHFRSSQKTTLAGHGRRHQQARADRLTMQPAVVVGGRFDGMAEGMAEVEQRPFAAFDARRDRRSQP